MRVALYTRVSTKDKGQNVENQAAELERFAATQGWTVSHRFSDNESGGKANRPQFQAMFDAASRREFDVLLFWSLDRLSREGVLETLHHLQRLTSYNVQYRSFTEQYLDTCGPFKDAVIAIFATIAKQERTRMGERIRAGLAIARARGKVPGQPRRKMNEARLVQLWHAGLSQGQIARELKAPEPTVRRRIKLLGLRGPAGEHVEAPVSEIA